MHIEHGDDHTVIHLDAREHAILMLLVGRANEEVYKSFGPAESNFIMELEDKL